jgi:type VI secretion system secreted protein Hcp
MRLLLNILCRTFVVLAGLSTLISNAAVAEVLETQVVIDHSNFTLLSSRRVTRTVSEYTLRAVAKNVTATEINNVKAKLTSVPSNITIVEGSVSFGVVAANSSVASSDEFTIRIDLRQAYSLADLKWQIEGDLPVTKPPGPDTVGIFMSIDNNAIKGEVDNRSHKDWIEVLAWSEGSSNSGTTHAGGAQGAGAFNLGDVSVTKYLDVASPALRLAIAEGRYFGEVKIDVIKDCKGKYTQYAITLRQVIVSSLSQGASGGQDKLVEQATFNTASIETMYTPVGPGCRFEPPIYSIQSYN